MLPTRQLSQSRSLRSHQNGFVLLPAIWLSGLIAAALSIFLVNSKVDTRAAGNAVQNSQAEFVADGAVRLVAFELWARPHLRSMGDGRAMHCSFPDGQTVIVAIQDQAGLIDLNSASPTTLQALGHALGFPEEKAQALADRIVDYRDRDHDPRPYGAEAKNYEAQAPGTSPKNGAFQVAGELDQVLGVTDDMRERLSSYITIYSHQDGIDQSAAPTQLRSHSFIRIPTIISQRRAFAIDVLVSGPSGGKFHRQAIVQILGRPERPFAISEWNRGSTEAVKLLEQASYDHCGLAMLSSASPTY
jgi:general secretion pathway protein K